MSNSSSEVTSEGVSFNARLKSLLGEDGFNEWVQLGNAERAVIANANRMRNSDVFDRSGGVLTQARQ